MFASGKTSAASTGGYQISRSLRFNSADSAYLNRTPASTTNRQIWTWSGWVKRGKLGVYGRVFQAREGSTGNQFFLRFNNTDTIFVTGDSGSYTLETTQVFRDPSAWYHIVFACDTTQATSSNRFKLYVNGSQVTAFGTATYPSQNLNTTVNSAFPHGLGAETSGPSEFFDGYITETYLIDGTQLTPSSFGETDTQTGVWKPKAYSGSYGTNGFYLNFSDNSNTTAATLGKDYSGNGNNWTPNGFSVSSGAGNDSLVDSPTSYGTDTGVGGTVRGNYCTWNPLDIQNSVLSLTNGNLDYSGGTTGFIGSRGTIGMTSGKWYWEMTAGGVGNVYGIMTSAATTVGIDFYPGRDANGWGYYGGNGNKFNNNSGTSYGATFTNGDVIGIAFDADAGTLVFYKNGTSQGTAFSSLTSGPYFPAFGESATTGSTNFGQRPFAYTAPSGFKALCTQNLPTPTIGATTATQANKYFNVVLRNGAGSAGGTFSTTVNMANGALLWDKTRNLGGDNLLTDSVRGISKYLVSNTTGAEATDVNYVTAFGTNSYTVGSSDWPTDRTVVDWMWAANGSGSTNTAGSITSTVSANTTSGFSIVTYSGQSAAGTVGHGLGVVPSMIIVKSRSNSSYGWAVWHSAFTQSEYLILEATDSKGTASNYWNSSAPSTWTSAFGVGAGPKYNNNSGDTFVAYCFAEVAGYSKFGTYTGNGSADGPFVYTGFRPAYLLVKHTNGTNYWFVFDSARDTFNAVDLLLNPNDSRAEIPNALFFDFLSNGFKSRATDAGQNASGGTYIYMAFASNPFKYSLAR